MRQNGLYLPILCASALQFTTPHFKWGLMTREIAAIGRSVNCNTIDIMISWNKEKAHRCELSTLSYFFQVREDTRKGYFKIIICYTVCHLNRWIMRIVLDLNQSFYDCNLPPQSTYLVKCLLVDEREISYLAWIKIVFWSYNTHCLLYSIESLHSHKLVSRKGSDLDVFLRKCCPKIWTLI